MDQGCARDSSDEDCGWIGLADGQTDRGNTSDASGYSAHQHLLQIGGMLELSHDLTLDGSIGYGWEELNVSGGAAGIDGGSTTAAVGLAYRPGPLELGADLAVGYAGYNSERTITVGTATGEAQAHPELWNADLRLSAAYDIALSNRWTLKPFAHLDLAEVRTGGFDEEGSTDFNLIIDGQSHGALSGQTGLELTADVAFENGLIVRPLLSAGVEGLDGDVAAAFAAGFHDAGLHFAGGFFRVGEGEDIFAAESGVGLEEMADAFGDDAGLAGAGAGDDKQRAVAVIDGAALGVVELEGAGFERGDVEKRGIHINRLAEFEAKRKRRRR